MVNGMQAQGPVVIGGIGGSGTRVVAQMHLDMGFYLGSDMDRAHDNLSFTFLFKRPQWFAHHACHNKELVFRGLSILTKAMTGRLHPSPSELGFLVRAIAERGYARRTLGVSGRLKRLRWAFVRARKLLRSGEIDLSRYVGWGWKEPNSHMYLEHLGEYSEDCKFIHVIRHGLDMAYSKNWNQLRNWGPFFGVDVPRSVRLRPQASLEFWIKANQRATALGERMGRDRFLLVNYDQLCSSPRTGTERMIDFLKLDKNELDFDYLCSIPQAPTSVGRYKEHDLSAFDREAIDAVRELGFVVEA
jgi:hypothetical protein